MIILIKEAKYIEKKNTSKTMQNDIQFLNAQINIVCV